MIQPLFNKFDGMLGAVAEATKVVLAKLDDIEGTIDTLRDKQINRFAPVRQERIDQLVNEKDRLLAALDDIESAKDAVETARDHFDPNA